MVLHRCVGDLGKAVAAGASWLPEAAPWVVRSLLAALDFLHEQKEICHGDVKPANVLLDEYASLKLADLGAAARCRGGGRATLVGSPAYQSPELVAIDHLGLALGGARYSFPADLWAVGTPAGLQAGHRRPRPALAARGRPRRRSALNAERAPRFRPALPPARQACCCTSC